MARKFKILTSAAEVVTELGGIAAVAELTGRSYHAAGNWPTWTKSFPPDTYVELTKALKRRRVKAPDSLWGMVPPRTNGKLP
jgi:hypothetical protein